MMEPPVRSIPLPTEVADLIAESMQDGITGEVTIYLRRGSIQAAEATRRIDLHNSPREMRR